MVPVSQEFTAEEQQILSRYGRRCYITNHPIAEDERVEFDHIEAKRAGGPDDIDNKAPICSQHNRQKGGDLSLMEFRDKLEMQEFFSGAPLKKLDDVLNQKFQRFGLPVQCEPAGDGATATLWLADNWTVTVPLTTCPATGIRYFYAAVPFPNLKNDLDLQPRPLDPKRVWELYRHLKRNTLLAPAVCRLTGTSLLLFDGQHKAAAEAWAGRKTIDCKVYLKPDARQMKETNLTAHEKLRQMPFYTSTLMRKYSDIFADDWADYIGQAGEKSESGFVRYLQAYKNKTKRQAVKEIRMFLTQQVMDSEDPPNRLKDFVAAGNRPGKQPLTHSILQKTFFKEFLCPPPLTVPFESEEDFRDQERQNLATLMTIVAAETLIDRWNPDADDAEHKKAKRIYSAGAVRACAPILRNVVAQILHVYDDSERLRLLFRPIDPDLFEVIRGRVQRMFNHPIWLKVDPSIDDALGKNQLEPAQRVFNREGFTTTWILGE